MREVRQSDPISGGFVPDTIFAPATGTGRAAVAIIRISGPGAHEALRTLIGGELPPWRELVLRAIGGRGGEIIDRAMVVAFPAGASCTGEAMAEVHCHGSRAVVADLLSTLAALPGCRLAEPGEFTQRAFLAGRMDLSQVEGLADLIAAETSEQRRQALRVHAGAVSRQAEAWRALIVRARALVEVTIDWADEEVPEDVLPEVDSVLGQLEAALEGELARAGAAERMRTGFEVAIIGPPNVGKSSLLNAISGRDAAIVSEVAGTTRDVLEVRFDLLGIPVTFLDTAGLREACDPVERIGVERARRRAAGADFRIFMRSADTAPGAVEPDLWRAGDILVWSKCDLGSAGGTDADVLISTTEERGLDHLLSVLRERLTALDPGCGVLAHARQRLAVEDALSSVRRGRRGLGNLGLEQTAEELRSACHALDRLVGRIGVENVLDEVFGTFCLGK